VFLEGISTTTYKSTAIRICILPQREHTSTEQSKPQAERFALLISDPTTTTPKKT